ncbi:MAG TPA: hypothetical protein PKV17_03025 [Aquabacterium sp.]|nr:hypothetical protein [Aquabacterium sp.]
MLASNPPVTKNINKAKGTRQAGRSTAPSAATTITASSSPKRPS